MISGVLLMMAGASLSAAGEDKATREAVALMHQFTQCLVRTKRATIEKVLAHPPGSKKATSAFVDAHPHECLRPEQASELRMKNHLFRGALAEHLFTKDFDSVGRPAKRKTSPIFSWPTSQEIAGSDEDLKRDLAIVEFGECVAKAAPAEVTALFGTLPESSGEKDILGGLVPKISLCVPEGQELTFGTVSLRAMLAEGAYRVAVQSQPQNGQAQ